MRPINDPQRMDMSGNGASVKPRDPRDIPPEMAERARRSVLRPIELEIERIFPAHARALKWKELTEARRVKVVYQGEDKPPLEIETPDHRIQMESMRELSKIASDFPAEQVDHRVAGVVLHVRYGHRDDRSEPALDVGGRGR